jgi:type VI protein secretion system component VasF
MPPTAHAFFFVAQHAHRAVQVPVWAAVLLLLGLIVVGYVLWKIRSDR